MCVYLYKDVETEIGRMKKFKVSNHFGIKLITYLVLISLKLLSETISRSKLKLIEISMTK